MDFGVLCDLTARGLREGAYPAAALAAGVGAEVFVRETFGDCRRETLFDLASITKVLAPALTVLRMCQAGRLSLACPLGEILPEAPPDKAAITLLQLLTHTAGFPAHFFLSRFAAAPEEALAALLAHPLAQPPGQAPLYSCMGYLLLGCALQRREGAGLDALAREWVFAPAGLRATGYCPRGEAAPTEWDEGLGAPLTGVVHDENARFMEGVAGNAGVFSDLADMSRFARMLSLGGRLPEGEVFLTEESFRAMIRDYTPRGPEHRGLGVCLASTPGSFLGETMSRRAFGHTGFTGTSFAVDPETGLWVVLLTNRVCPSRENLALLALRRRIHNAAGALLRGA